MDPAEVEREERERLVEIKKSVFRRRNKKQGLFIATYKRTAVL